MTIPNELYGAYFRKLAVLALLSMMCLASSFGAARAQGNQALPPLPAQPILDKVISETGGAKRTAIAVPQVITSQSLAVAVALNPKLAQAPAAAVFDLSGAVYYFGLDKALKRLLIPIANSESVPLGPTLTTADGLPAQMIGAGYDFSSGPIVLVVVWKDSKATKPQDLRVYTLTNGQLAFTTPNKLIYRKLKGNKNGKVAPLDKGVIIAARETCFSLSSDQICYAPTKQDKRADAKAGAQIDDAIKALTKTYSVKAKIDADGALPEIAGVTARSACSAKLAAVTSAAAMVSIPECAANMAFAGVNDNPPGAVIGALSLTTAIDQPAYDLSGNAVGRVAAGTYLIIDATPTITDAGMAGVLMLVNADGKQNVLIPSQIIEGFGDSDDKTNNANKGQAGIKDATVGAHGF
jgi:hypothetical protein